MRVAFLELLDFGLEGGQLLIVSSFADEGFFSSEDWLFVQAFGLGAIDVFLEFPRFLSGGEFTVGLLQGLDLLV